MKLLGGIEMAEVISSGHSLDVRGAAGFIEEVNEARAVVKLVVKYLKELETVMNFMTTSKSQNENLKQSSDFITARRKRLVVHFNAGGGEGNCYYGLKRKISSSII
jgi:N-acetylmuramoyl-L-alanine amidase